MTRRTRMVCLLAAVFGAAWILTVQAQSTKVTRSIDHISGGLYKFTNKFHASVFLVTDDGIIATDPINAAATLFFQMRLYLNLPLTNFFYELIYWS